MVGLLGIAALIPLLTVSIVAGAVADAVDRRRLLLVSDLGLAADGESGDGGGGDDGAGGGVEDVAGGVRGGGGAGDVDGEGGDGGEQLRGVYRV